MIRLASFFCLLVALIAIAFTTLGYVDPPITDPLVFGFVKSDRYLPPDDTIQRRELYVPVEKLLQDDRRAYKTVLLLSCVAMLSGCVLFISGRGRVCGRDVDVRP